MEHPVEWYEDQLSKVLEKIENQQGVVFPLPLVKIAN